MLACKFKRSPGANLTFSFLSPDGVKVRSKPELQLLVGDSLDLSNFNFRLGEFLDNKYGRPSSKVKISIVISRFYKQYYLVIKI